MVSQITLSKLWGGGLAMPTSCISELLLRHWLPCHCSLLETFGWCIPALISGFCSRIGFRILRRRVTTLRGMCVFCCFCSGRVGLLQCLGLFGDGSEIPCHPVRGPLLSPSTLESLLAWVVPTRRVAMDTSLQCLKCSGPLPTFKAPVPKLIDW